MKLHSIEPTPSPNSMKLNLSEILPIGQRYTYTKEQAESAPALFQQLLRIEGVRSVFHTADFIALDRRSGADWAAILAEVQAIFQQEGGNEQLQADVQQGVAGHTSYGEANVLVQMYRGIPIQVRVRTGMKEVRSALPDSFFQAVTEAAGSSMIRERRLEEFGVRYGDPTEIAAEIVKELDASYTAERLAALVKAAKEMPANAEAELITPVRPEPLAYAEAKKRLALPDWKERYAALDRYIPEMEGLDLLAKALGDENTSIRRLAVIYLGDLKEPEVLPLLFKALQDSSVSVRRTAGDTLSDIGDPAAIGPMIESLADKNKLVRWRAARFLYEAGDESAIPALKIAAEDKEFEIKLQAQMALERIERGEEAAGSVWQQMTAARARTSDTTAE